MNNTQILVNNTEGTQPICVYRKKKDQICLFYGYVNIGMCQTCFEKLCRSIFEIHRQIEQGTVEASHITVNYASTTLVLPVDDFCLMSSSLASAQERLAFLEKCDDAGIVPMREACDAFADIPILPLPHIPYNSQRIHLN